MVWLRIFLPSAFGAEFRWSAELPPRQGHAGGMVHINSTPGSAPPVAETERHQFQGYWLSIWLDDWGGVEEGTRKADCLVSVSHPQICPYKSTMASHCQFLQNTLLCILRCLLQICSMFMASPWCTLPNSPFPPAIGNLSPLLTIQALHILFPQLWQLLSSFSSRAISIYLSRASSVNSPLYGSFAFCST